jgi:phosphatidylserine decarboxylase
VAPVSTPLRLLLSHAVGWLTDRPIPRRLRPAVHRRFARLLGADLDETRPPLEAYPTLGAFFVRRLVDGARPFDPDPGVLPCPVDGRIQTIDAIAGDTLFQAKGQPYSLTALLGGAERGGAGLAPVDLRGGQAFTVYLSPRDYHRIHCPVASVLEQVTWLAGGRHSVAPAVLLRRPRVFAENERVVLRLRAAQGTWFLVLVGALNVGRIRVVGVDRGASRPSRRDPSYGRGEELARFELGSTIIALWPAGTAVPRSDTVPGTALRMGQALADFAPAVDAAGTRVDSR